MFGLQKFVQAYKGQNANSNRQFINNPPFCTPKTCRAWDNGCSQSINCGNCSSGQTCNNGVCTNTNSQIILFVYVRDSRNNLIQGASVSGTDGVGNVFSNYATGTQGFAAIFGYTGTWKVLVSKQGYTTYSTTQYLSSTTTINAVI